MENKEGRGEKIVRNEKKYSEASAKVRFGVSENVAVKKKKKRANDETVLPSTRCEIRLPDASANLASISSANLRRSRM